MLSIYEQEIDNRFEHNSLEFRTRILRNEYEIMSGLRLESERRVKTKLCGFF